MLINLGSIVNQKVLTTLGTVLSLVLVDFVLGVLVSLKNGNFSASKLPKFVETSLIPYIGGLFALALFSNANAELGVLFFTIAATITVKFLAEITSKVTQLFSEIQNPINVTPVVQQVSLVTNALTNAQVSTTAVTACDILTQPENK